VKDAKIDSGRCALFRVRLFQLGFSKEEVQGALKAAGGSLYFLYSLLSCHSRV